MGRAPHGGGQVPSTVTAPPGRPDRAPPASGLPDLPHRIAGMGYEHDVDRRRAGRGGRRRRRPLRALAATVGVVALLGVLTIAGYLFYLQRTVEGNI